MCCKVRVQLIHFILILKLTINASVCILVNEYGLVHYVFEFFFKTKFHAYKDMSVLIVEIALLFISFGLKSDS